MKRKGFLAVVAVALLGTTAVPARASLTILTGTYRVRGDALHYISHEEIHYDITHVSAPLFYEINQPFDDDGFNAAGPYLLYASSLATRYRSGGDMVFQVDSTPFDYQAGSSMLPAEAHTRADLVVDFAVAGISQLHVETISQAVFGEAAVFADLTDLDTSASWSLVPDEFFSGVTQTIIPVDPTHTYRLDLTALDVEWLPSSVVVKLEDVVVPAPGAAALVAVGLMGIAGWRRTRRGL